MVMFANKQMQTSTNHNILTLAWQHWTNIYWHITEALFISCDHFLVILLPIRLSL